MRQSNTDEGKTGVQGERTNQQKNITRELEKVPRGSEKQKTHIHTDTHTDKERERERERESLGINRCKLNVLFIALGIFNFALSRERECGELLF